MEQVNNKTIHFFICPHGFGHIRRALKTIKILLNDDARLHITIHVKATHLAGFQTLLPEWDADTTGSPRISWITNTMIHCPDFSNQEYSADSYEKWLQALKAWMDSHENILVVSDNLVAPAFYSNRALLMGSFLWSSVVTENYLPDYQFFAKAEQAMLNQRKLPMLALQDMAMPDVRRLTQMIPMPWFCDQNPLLVPEIKSKYKVLLSVGGTSKWLEKGMELLDRINKNQGIELYLDQGLYKALDTRLDTIQLFSFEDEAFSQLDLVIARPGIGILTDCVAFNTPIVAIGENANAEIVHNARVISEKGWGWDLVGEEIETIGAVCKEIVQNGDLISAKNKLAMASCGGAEQAANFIRTQLN